MFKDFRISARGIPRGGVAFSMGFRISARGIPRGGVAFSGISVPCASRDGWPSTSGGFSRPRAFVEYEILWKRRLALRVDLDLVLT